MLGRLSIPVILQVMPPRGTGGVFLHSPHSPQTLDLTCTQTNEQISTKFGTETTYDQGVV